jgi:glycosyltransferase involved in cell wall biosynthesis
MHVVELSYMYPSPRHPTSGVFIERQARELARLVGVDVVSPVPWAPRPLWSLSPRWRGYGRQPRESRCQGVRVHHPRYLQPVGQWSIPFAGVTMAVGARPLLARLVRSRGVDVIHAHNLLPEGLAGVLLGRWLDRPVVCTLHGTDVGRVPFHDRMARGAARLVARACDAFTSVAPALVERLRELGPVRGPALTVPYGVDIERFQPRDRGAARRRLGLAPEGPLVVYAGLLIARKGVDVLLEAVAHVAARRPDLRLVCVGGSAERDDRTRALAAQAGALGIGDRVAFVGPRPHDEMPLWLAAADVFALASRHEGFPNVVREAIACGTPCVATALPGLPETLGPECARLVAPDDAAAFAAALEDALAREWDRAAIRRRALEWGWERSARDTLDVLVAATQRRTAAVA